MWKFFFTKFCSLLFGFFFLFFCYFWQFIFNFLYLYLSKNYRNFYVFFILWIKDFNKEFWKIMEYFSKKYKHLKSKIHHKFHRLLIIFFLFFCHFGNVFFLFYLSKLVKKFYIFVVLYCTDYRFYHRILGNSWIFIKKKRDTLNTKHFQNSIVYYLLFLFFSIFDIFLFYFTCLWHSQKF